MQIKKKIFNFQGRYLLVLCLQQYDQYYISLFNDSYQNEIKLK